MAGIFISIGISLILTIISLIPTLIAGSTKILATLIFKLPVYTSVALAVSLYAYHKGLNALIAIPLVLAALFITTIFQRSRNFTNTITICGIGLLVTIGYYYVGIHASDSALKLMLLTFIYIAVWIIFVFFSTCTETGDTLDINSKKEYIYIGILSMLMTTYATNAVARVSLPASGIYYHYCVNPTDTTQRILGILLYILFGLIPTIAILIFSYRTFDNTEPINLPFNKDKQMEAEALKQENLSKFNAMFEEFRNKDDSLMSFVDKDFIKIVDILREENKLYPCIINDGIAYIEKVKEFDNNPAPANKDIKRAKQYFINEASYRREEYDKKYNALLNVYENLPGMEFFVQDLKKEYLFTTLTDINCASSHKIKNQKIFSVL